MILRLASAGLLAYTFGLIWSTVPNLPPRIPTHFNAAGRPNGWGSPEMLWLLFSVQLGLTFMLFVLPWAAARFPNLGHVGPRRLAEFPREQREHIVAILRRMLDLDALFVNGLLAYICRGTIQAARSPGAGLAPRPMAVMMGAAVVSSLYYAWKLMQINWQAARSVPPAGGANSTGSPPLA